MAFYLVTGGAGFIGSNAVEELLRRQEKVRVLDNFSTGKRDNLGAFMDQIELIEGDLRDFQVAREAVEGMDYILHLGALPSVARSVKDPIASNETNVCATVNLLTAAKGTSVKRIVFTSSSSVYGDTPVLPKVEDITPHPRSPYAVSKLAGEYYCRVFTLVYGLETVILRYFNIFGPRQDPTSQYAAVIPLFIRTMMKGENPIIYGDGWQSRDFTFVANAVSALLLAAKVPQAAGGIFNIACGERHSLRELIERLNVILGTKIEPKYAESRLGDVKHSLADISQARKILGYEPIVNFERGLKQTVEWNRAETSR